MSLYIKYRPTTLSEMKGNSGILSILEKTIQNKKTCPHSFLLTGPTGCGKTTAGRIIANELGCTGSDFREIDSAHLRGVDTVRDIINQAQYMPISGGSCIVWLVDECHKLTNDAQNAFLKILEDTPKHVYFILCTSEPAKLIATIKGRCSTYNFNPLEEDEMFKLLRKVTKAEGFKIDESLKELFGFIYKSSEGHPRNALQILENVLKIDDPETRKLMAKVSEEHHAEIIHLCRALLARKSWKEVASILSNLKGEEPETIRRNVMGYCSAVLLKGSMHAQAIVVLEEFLEPFFNTGFPGLTYACAAAIK